MIPPRIPIISSRQSPSVSMAPENAINIDSFPIEHSFYTPITCNDLSNDPMTYFLGNELSITLFLSFH